MIWYINILLLLVFIAQVPCMIRNINIPLNDVKHVRSPGFPSSCCRPQSVKLRVATSTDVGYLRMTFEDLDLPAGSRLEIFDVRRTNTAILFPDQPELVNGVWTRPVLASTDNLSGMKIRFYPSNVSASGHVGYKARVWVTNSPPDRWHYKPITDECMPVLSPFSGHRITQKSLGHIYEQGRAIDCVWQIKVPSVHEEDELIQESLRVYARVTHLGFTGYLDIRSGVSSEGDSLLALSGPPALSLMGLDMPRGGFTSRDGLYIRLSMLNQPGGLLAFTFGIFHAQEDLLNTGGHPHKCSFGDWGRGFLCTNETWCVPEGHKCNRVNNCASREDEITCEAPPKRTTSTTTSTTIKPTTAHTSLVTHYLERACGMDQVACFDGYCDQIYSGCNLHSGRRCIIGNKFCPHLGGCVRHYSSDHQCHGYCDWCEGGSCTHDGQCPGVCTGGTKMCPEGCRPMRVVCSDQCNWWEKVCNDGTCVQKYEFCDDESCPDDFYKCGDLRQCYNGHYKCDGYPDCADDSDELRCPAESGSYLSYDQLAYLPLLIPVVLLVIIVIIVCKWKRKSNANRNTCASHELAEGGAMLGEGDVHSGINQGINGTAANPTELESGTQQSAPAMPVPEPSAPPPSYDEVVTGGNVAPPPSYSSI